jgi:hypothetical protein
MTGAPTPRSSTAEDPRPWRRVIGAGCIDCGWRVQQRDWRSARSRNRKAMIKAAQLHVAATGHEHVGVFHAHV